ncbi:MAG: hypothetical protein HXY50_01590 [Ignavibacteriaceae bacterium]|nr:hypothetical protein [Ignavibacteriaceae bacterium]
MKLLLSKEQIAKIDTLLTEPLCKSITKTNKDEKINFINEKVISILNNKQRIKFELLKTSWLEELATQPE